MARLDEFTSRFRQLCDETGMNHTKIGESIGLNRQTVEHYYNGKRIPDALFLLQIADAFGVSADWLLGRAGSVRSLDANIQATCKYTGLSEDAVNKITTNCNSDLLSLILESKDFTSIFAYINLEINSRVLDMKLQGKGQSLSSDVVDEATKAGYSLVRARAAVKLYREAAKTAFSFTIDDAIKRIFEEIEAREARDDE